MLFSPSYVPICCIRFLLRSSFFTPHRSPIIVKRPPICICEVPYIGLVDHRFEDTGHTAYGEDYPSVTCCSTPVTFLDSVRMPVCNDPRPPPHPKEHFYYMVLSRTEPSYSVASTYIKRYSGNKVTCSPSFKCFNLYGETERLVFRVQEVPGSNLDPETGYPEGFVGLLSPFRQMIS
jgi:hypothetical protein